MMGAKGDGLTVSFDDVDDLELPLVATVCNTTIVPQHVCSSSVHHLVKVLLRYVGELSSGTVMLFQVPSVAFCYIRASAWWMLFAVMAVKSSHVCGYALP
jgi:hypothetical protein